MTKDPGFVSVVIPAAGKGARMESSINKQFECIKGIPVLARTIMVFAEIPEVDEIIVVCAESDFAKIQALLSDLGLRKGTKTVTGGSTRQESVFNGIKSCSAKSDILIVHDGARPFVTREIILRAIRGAREFGACCAGVPVKDTIKTCDESGFILKTLKRETLMSVQTPQAFKYRIIKEAYEKAYDDEYFGTDDISLVERLGIKCKIVAGSYDNIKITTKEDLILADLIAGNYT